MQNEENPQRQLPFNNLFLNSAAVHGNNNWWMYVVGTAGALFGYFGFQLIIGIVLGVVAAKNGISITDIKHDPSILSSADRLGMDKNFYLALMLGMFVCGFLCLLRVARKVHHKTLTSILTGYEKIRFNRIFFAFAVWGILNVTIVLVAYYMGEENLRFQFNPANFIWLVVVCLLLMPFQTSFEEILFRGYLLQGLSLLFKNGLLALIVTSLIFGLAHMSNPEARAFGWGIMLPYYSLFGLFLGLLTLLDEGLELALGIHFANNFTSGLLLTSPNNVLKTDALFVAKTENPYSEMLAWGILALITFTIFWLKYRWKNFNLIIK